MPSGRELDDRRQRRPQDRSATPALICPVCRRASPLDEVHAADGRSPRCLHCDSSFGDREAGVATPHQAVVMLFEALHADAVDVLRDALDEGVVWSESEGGTVLRGARMVSEHLTQAGVRRSLRAVTTSAGVAHVRVVEAGVGAPRTVTWMVEVTDGRIVRVHVDPVEVHLDPSGR